MCWLDPWSDQLKEETFGITKFAWLIFCFLVQFNLCNIIRVDLQWENFSGQFPPWENESHFEWDFDDDVWSLEILLLLVLNDDLRNPSLPSTTKP